MFRAATARALVALAVVSAGFAVATTMASPAAAVACADDASALWLRCAEVGRTAATVVEEVTYPSTDPVPVAGTICRPTSAGPHPILVLNHGGFRALRPVDERVCRAWAADGWFVVASHYRRMNTGPAGDDLCEGEVDDVLAMLAIARTHPGADGGRVVLRGGSHGGCVTLRAYERGMPGLVAAAAFMPLSDPASTYRFAADPGVRAQIAQSTGGSPAAAAARAAGIGGSDVPLLITHGVDDTIVDVRDSCALVLGHGFVPVHVGDGPLPEGCDGFAWSTLDPSWSGDRWFLVYDGVGHTAGAMGDDIDAFLRAKVDEFGALGRS
jgi:dienelactone hydrolase